ncbi:MAG: hypothetical protein AAF564_08465 [Bacteroidota bacterium]
MIRTLLALVPLLMIFSQVKGQEVIPFDSEQWSYDGTYSIEEYKGAKALLLSPGSTAELPGISMKDGIIEYDVAFGAQRGFVFTFFRMVDNINHEELYFRPHRSGDPDAIQYTPNYNGVHGWQLYQGPNYSIDYKYKDNEWMHIKMVIKGARMEVFIDNMKIPALEVFELRRDPVAGYIAFRSILTDTRIANVTVSQPNTIQFVGESTQVPQLAPEVVSSWEVSNAFAKNRLGLELNHMRLEDLAWSDVDTEFTGVANLARVGVLNEEENTVLAKFIVHSEIEQLKQLEFGYSDIARIYVNGKAVYDGQREFLSRDYRYQGTVGFFDSLFLDLKQGENEIVFAVTEELGGWGVLARFVDLEKITVF